MKNENLIVRTTSFAMYIVKAYISEGDTVADCTMGNGFDTLELAKSVGSSGRVFAFDIQPLALKKTVELLEENNMPACSAKPEINLILDSHVNLEKHLSKLRGGISAFVFNLGYMPGENKEITTEFETTLRAVKQALRLVKTNGIVSVTVYRGHEAGALEAKALGKFFSELPAAKYHTAFIEMINQTSKAPAIYIITPKTDDREWISF